MRSILKITVAVLVKAFYQENAVFFLFIIGFTCGFMSGIEHAALAQFFISSPLTMLIPFAVWTVYAFKIVDYNRVALKRTENSFLFNIAFLNNSAQWFLCLCSALFQLAPAVLYGTFLILFAIREQQPVPIAMIISSLITIWALMSLMLRTGLQHPELETKTGWFTRVANKTVRQYPLFVVEWIGREHGLVLIVTKALSGSLLIGVMKLYSFEAYDSRLLGLGIVIVAGMNTHLIYETHRFENNLFSITRQLPIVFSKRVANLFMSLLILFLIETAIIITYFPVSLSLIDQISAILLVYSILLLSYGLQFLRSYTHEQHTRLTFICSIALILFVLFKIPLLVIASINFVTGLGVWKVKYYRYEIAGG